MRSLSSRGQLPPNESAGPASEARALGVDCAALLSPSKRPLVPAFLESAQAPRRIMLLAVLLLLPGLASGFVLDDFVLALKAAPETRMPALPSEPLGLFTFTTGDPQRNAALMDEAALLPWWGEPRHLNAFFRPLSALTHVLDFRAWPECAWLMHLHSVLWFVALLCVLWHAYRSLEPGAQLTAAWALLLYAVDDAHGATVGWIANRNALVSVTLALPALALHHRAARSGEVSRIFLAALCVALGLCAGEMALCVVGYLAAYAICLDQRPLRTRLLSLLPYALLFVTHRALYRVLGLGSFGSGGYHDPLNEPGAFLATLGYNLPLLLSSQLFVPIADLGFWGDVRARAALWLWAVLSLAAVVWFMRGLLLRDRTARFWALGMLLAAVPVSASLPGERLLLALGFGAAPLLARLFQELGVFVRASSSLPRLGQALVVLHLIVAPVLLPIRAYALAPLGHMMQRFDAALPRTAAVREQIAIVLNAPFNVMVNYLQISRALHGVPRPAHLYWLTTASSETEVTRVAPNVLQVTQEAGFLRRPEDTHYRGNAYNLPVGTRVTRAGMQIEVVAVTSDARPATVRFRFDEPLDSARYLFYVYRSGRLLRVPPVASGERVRLPAEDFFLMNVAEVLR
jgi:hypothetical protein